MIKVPDWGWSSALVLSFIAAGIVVMGLFTLRQRRTRFPLMVLSLFNNLLFHFYWQGLRGYSIQTAGLLMMPILLSLMFTALIAERLSDTWDHDGLPQ